jgi:hypothetical protein
LSFPKPAPGIPPGWPAGPPDKGGGCVAILLIPFGPQTISGGLR